MQAVQTKEDVDLRDKIKTFLVKLDKMEERVKEVESISKALPRLEAQLSKVISRVDEVVARVESEGRSPAKEHSVHKAAPAPTPVRAFVGGATIAMLLIGLIIVAWMFGMF